jgi:hypothetical protein
MDNTEQKSGSLVGDISNNLSPIIRHLLPGILILCATHIAYPSWFTRMDLTLWTHVLVAGVIAVVAGNVAFVVNRYFIHQLIDWLAYMLAFEAPARKGWPNYLEDLGKHVVNSDKLSSDIGRHIIFRTSSILFLYTIVELTLIFSFWHDPMSPFALYQLPMRWAGGLILVAAIFQHLIVRRIGHFSQKYKGF